MTKRAHIIIDGEMHEVTRGYSSTDTELTLLVENYLRMRSIHSLPKWWWENKAGRSLSHNGRVYSKVNAAEWPPLGDRVP